MKKRTCILSMTLAVLLCAALLPISALAAEEAPEPVVIELPGVIEEEASAEEEVPVEAEPPIEEETPVEETPAEEKMPEEEETPVMDGAATSGTCGDNLTWTLSDDGILTISGSGAMEDYETQGAPWFGYADRITAVVIEQGVTGVGEYAFYGCRYMAETVISESVETIGEGAFSGCEMLLYITIQNPKTEIYAQANTMGNASKTVIYGYAGSTAESYAEAYGYTFVVLGVPVDETTFPDEVFRNHVSTKFDTDKDGILSPEELAAVETISGLGAVTSLEGIQYFTELKSLYCSNRNLTALDVSKNTALTTLNCSSNALTTLDVSKNTALTTLNCSSNDLTALDVSKNTALTTLNCSSNDLTTLDVSRNTALKTLSCCNCGLTSLNISANMQLAAVYCDSNKIDRLDISDIDNLVKAAMGQVGGGTISVSFFCGEEVGLNYYTYCLQIDYYTELVSKGEILNQEFVDDGRISEDTILTAIDETAFPDDVFRSVVEAFDKDGDGRLSKGEANQVDSLVLSNRGISSVQGLEYFSRLSYLYLYQNNLTEVDLSGNLLMRRMLADVGGVQEGKNEYQDNLGVSFLCADEGVVFHCYSQWRETKAGTCVEAGEEQRACDWCESVQTRQSALGDHVWDDGAVTVKPTLANGGAGKILYSCANCTETKTEDIGCFAGDVNGDGDVNAADMVCLVRYILGGDVEVNPATIDPTGDEKTNILDVVRLMRYLAGYDVAL